MGIKDKVGEIIGTSIHKFDVMRQIDDEDFTVDYTEEVNEIHNLYISAIEGSRTEFADYILYMTSPEKAKIPKTRQKALEISDTIISKVKEKLK